MEYLFGVFLLTLQVITGIGVVRSANLFAAVMLSGIFSMLMAANLFLLDAPDVALTEAAVGAGISTVLLLSALQLTTTEERKPLRRRPLVPLLVVAITTVAIVHATFETARFGDPDAPVHRHVVPYYIEETARTFQIPNVVTAVLGSFRGYDTFGELLVVFTAGLGVLVLLGPPRQPDEGRTGVAKSLAEHLIPQVVGRLLIPFIILFGLYVMFHGEHSPGGGFQGGTLIAAAMMLHALLAGERATMAALPFSVLQGMISGGVLLYGGVGVYCMLRGGGFLEYAVLAADQAFAQQTGLLLIETGVGITVTGVLLTIFHCFATREA